MQNNAAAALDRQVIHEIVDAWAICRDSGDWDGLRACWHPDGIMNATWFQGGVEQFIDGAKRAFERPGMSAHLQGACKINLAGSRAIAQTRVTIYARDELDGHMCDIASLGRFYDFFEKREGRWGMAQRQPIYERDRVDPVEPGLVLRLDPAILARFPAGYRHLAYAQVQRGLPVKTDMPGLHGPEVEALYARGAAWLAGA